MSWRKALTTLLPIFHPTSAVAVLCAKVETIRGCVIVLELDLIGESSGNRIVQKTPLIYPIARQSSLLYSWWLVYLQGAVGVNAQQIGSATFLCRIASTRHRTA